MTEPNTPMGLPTQLPAKTAPKRPVNWWRVALRAAPWTVPTASAGAAVVTYNEWWLPVLVGGVLTLCAASFCWAAVDLWRRLLAILEKEANEHDWRNR